MAQRLTTARFERIRERAVEACFFANSSNLASIELHRAFGFTEVGRSASIHGIEFAGGEGILFRADLSSVSNRRV